MPGPRDWDDDDYDDMHNRKPVFKGTRNYESFGSSLGEKIDDAVTTVSKAAGNLKEQIGRGAKKNDALDKLGSKFNELGESIRQSDAGNVIQKEWAKVTGAASKAIDERKLAAEIERDRARSHSKMPPGCYCDMRGYPCPMHKGKEAWRTSRVYQQHVLYNEPGGEAGQAPAASSSDGATTANASAANSANQVTQAEKDAMMAQLVSMGFDPDRVMAVLSHHRSLEGATNALLDTPEPTPAPSSDPPRLALSQFIGNVPKVPPPKPPEPEPVSLLLFDEPVQKKAELRSSESERAAQLLMLGELPALCDAAQAAAAPTPAPEPAPTRRPSVPFTPAGAGPIPLLYPSRPITTGESTGVLGTRNAMHMPRHWNANPNVPTYTTPTTPSPTLPPGWHACVDASNGIPYYFNTATQQSQWEHPGMAVPAALPPQSVTAVTAPTETAMLANAALHASSAAAASFVKAGVVTNSLKSCTLAEPNATPSATPLNAVGPVNHFSSSSTVAASKATPSKAAFVEAGAVQTVSNPCTAVASATSLSKAPCVPAGAIINSSSSSTVESSNAAPSKAPSVAAAADDKSSSSCAAVASAATPSKAPVVAAGKVNNSSSCAAAASNAAPLKAPCNTAVAAMNSRGLCTAAASITTPSKAPSVAAAAENSSNSCIAAATVTSPSNAPIEAAGAAVKSASSSLAPEATSTSSHQPVISRETSLPDRHECSHADCGGGATGAHDAHHAKPTQMQTDADASVANVPTSAPPTTPSPTLPAGWHACVDASNGIPYYFNTATQQSQWEHPGMAVPAAVTPQTVTAVTAPVETAPLADAAPHASVAAPHASVAAPSAPFVPPTVDTSSGSCATAAATPSNAAVNHASNSCTVAASNATPSTASVGTATAADKSSSSCAPVASTASPSTTPIVASETEVNHSSSSCAEQPSNATSTPSTAEGVVENSCSSSCEVVATSNPVHQAVTVQETLPPGWHECIHAESGLPYYFNTATQQSQWEHPGKAAAS